MAPDPVTQAQGVQPDAGVVVRVGGWLFRRRTLVPIPIVLAILFVPAGGQAPSPVLMLTGAGLVLFGEIVRLWGVHHIGAISRTRSDRLGPLIDTGPFAYSRNPLYLGNIALWSGFALCAGLPWLAPIIALLLFVEYHAIVRWEEQLLTERIGAAYRAYRQRVPRWLAGVRRQERTGAATDGRHHEDSAAERHWRDTFFSERGTLVAIVAGFFLLWMKARF